MRSRNFRLDLGFSGTQDAGYDYLGQGVLRTQFDLYDWLTALRIGLAQRSLAGMQSEPTRWYKYVLDVTEGMTAKEAADRAGFDQSAMSRWKAGMNADVKFVVQFARAFNQNVLKALAEAEFITDEEANLHEVRIGVEEMSTHQLLEELARRIDNGAPKPGIP